MSSSQDTWLNLRNENCQDCQLYEGAQCVCLMGDGAVPAKVMIVGEAPGFREDQVQKPFQGKAGKLLDSLLNEVGVKRDDIYITNICKCRPPDNRTPSKGEIKSCLPYLQKELEIVKPSIILALGNIALYGLTGHSGIGKYRGQELECKLYPATVIPTYHPAGVLRSPRYQGPWKNDMKKGFSMADGEKPKKYNPVIHIADNKESLKVLIKQLRRAMNSGKYGGLDIETTTFDYWRPETVVMTLGICVDEQECWAIPMEHPQSVWRGQSHKIIQILRPFLEGIKWVGNNWKFDIKWFRKKYGVTVNFGPDNMLIAYANDENQPHGLKYQADTHCHSGNYDKDIMWPKEFDPVTDDIKAKVQEYFHINLRKLLKYNALDAFYSYHVYPIERNLLLRDMRMARIYKHLLEKGSWVFMYVEEHGMWVDPSRLENATRKCQANIDALVERMNGMIPEGWMERNLSKKQIKKGFNWNSPQQLGKLLFQEDGFDFPVVQRTSTGKPSTSESVLIELGADFEHPLIEAIGEYRKWAKYMSTYLRPWTAKLDENSRLHPTFLLHGTVTGRLSGKDGVHQVPRDKFIRSLIGAPPGWSFFEIDGSQIELRCAAAIAMEQTMLRIFATGGDIHRTTASTVTGKPIEDITGDERKKAKAVNFGFLYGMGWKKFKQYAWEKYGIKLTDAEAKHYRERFFQLYSGLPAWHNRMRKIVRALGYVVSPIGRKRRLPDIYSVDGDLQAAAEREAINSPVQGFGSDYVLAAFIEIVLENILPQDPGFETIRPVGAVHDAAYFEIRNDRLDYWPARIKKIFDDPTRLKKWFGYIPPVAITGDCKIGTHWGDAREWVPDEPLPFEPR